MPPRITWRAYHSFDVAIARRSPDAIAFAGASANQRSWRSAASTIGIQAIGEQVVAEAHHVLVIEPRGDIANSRATAIPWWNPSSVPAIRALRIEQSIEQEMP